MCWKSPTWIRFIFEQENHTNPKTYRKNTRNDKMHWQYAYINPRRRFLCGKESYTGRAGFEKRTVMVGIFGGKNPRLMGVFLRKEQYIVIFYGKNPILIWIFCGKSPVKRDLLRKDPYVDGDLLRKETLMPSISLEALLVGHIVARLVRWFLCRRRLLATFLRLRPAYVFVYIYVYM